MRNMAREKTCFSYRRYPQFI